VQETKEKGKYKNVLLFYNRFSKNWKGRQRNSSKGTAGDTIQTP